MPTAFPWAPFPWARSARVLAAAAVLVSLAVAADLPAHAAVAAGARPALTQGTLTVQLSRNEWTMVEKAFPDRSYWETPGLLQVGDRARNSPHFAARSFVNMPVPAQIYGATIITA